MADGSTLALTDLARDPKNARTHDDRNLATIAQSLTDVGAARSIVIDEDGVVLAGNGTVAAAAQAGLTRVRVIEAAGDELIAVRRSNLTAEQKIRLALADNRTSELAGWDTQVLAELQAEVGDLSSLWSEQELNALLGLPTVEGADGAEPDDVPEPRATTDIQVGDLFALGRHRLLCGDCTDPVLVERLMQGERAGLMNTDPPYGIAFDNAALGPTRKAYKAIANDEHEDGASLQRFLESAFGIAKLGALRDNAAWYLWHAQLTQGFFAAAAAAANLVLHRQIIWVKPHFILGRGQYHWQHELCFMGWVDGHECPDYGLGHGERTQSSVWTIGGVSTAERAVLNHASPKPTELFTVPIVKHLRANEVCYEPFAGSGPQFIAAEQKGVRCFGFELDPQHCQTIIDRWQRFTSQTATKLS